MCSRFELKATPQDIVQDFGLPFPPPIPNSPEVRPTDLALNIGPNKQTSLNIWGIPAPWDGKPVFNARIETVSEKPLFRPYLQGRCVVPASSYPEWKKDSKKRIRHDISPKSEKLFAFAGLRNDEHMTIVTCPATDNLAEIHGRMPVMLPEHLVGAWIGGEDWSTFIPKLLACVPPGVNIVEKLPTIAPEPAQPDLFS